MFVHVCICFLLSVHVSGSVSLSQYDYISENVDGVKTVANCTAHVYHSPKFSPANVKVFH